MASTDIVVAILVAVAVVLLLWFIQIPLTGFGPRWAKKVWTKIIRCFKKGDVKPWDWTAVEEGVIYLSTLPRSKDNMRELLGAPHNVGAAVTLNEAWEVKVGEEEMEDLGVTWLHLPIPDYSAPDMKSVIRGVEFIHQHVQQGKGVLVHCNAGRGRSVVVTLSYLLMRNFQRGWSRDQAFEFVKGKRRVSNLKSRCGTHPQWRVVGRFERMLRKNNGTIPGRPPPAAPTPAAHDISLNLSTEVSPLNDSAAQVSSRRVAEDGDGLNTPARHLESGTLAEPDSLDRGSAEFVDLEAGTREHLDESNDEPGVNLPGTPFKQGLDKGSVQHEP